MKKILFLSTMTPHHYYLINRVIGFFPDVEFRVAFEQALVDTDAQYLYELAMWGEWIYGPLPVWHDETDNINRCLELIKEWEPDLGIVFGTRKIFSVIIDAFPDGLLNIHRGIIQKYRGLDSTYWAIYNNDFGDIGVTIHKIDSGLDTGPVVRQQNLWIKPGMELHHLRFHETEMASDMMISCIRDYLNGDLAYTPQTKPGKYYSAFPRRLYGDLVKNLTEYKRELWLSYSCTTA